MSLIKTLLDRLTNSIAEISAAAVAAALLAYFRSEASTGIKWAFEPLVRHFPWNRARVRRGWRERHQLLSELTLADLFLITADGKHAIYAKTGNYVVAEGPLSSYYEGVTTSGNVTGASTELGAIVQVTTEHGFYVSRIDLGSILEAGTKFRNVYRVQLDDSFVTEEEHWTQEIAVPTKHLTLRIHFPLRRPPKLSRSKQLTGFTQKQTAHGAAITELFGQRAIVWDIENPKLGDIYKLEWRW